MTPPPTQFAIAASFLFDWNDANRPIGMRVTIEHQEERPPVFEVRAHLTAGRPPQADAVVRFRVVDCLMPIAPAGPSS